VPQQEMGLILSEVVANHLHVVRGSQVSISTPVGEKSLPVLGVFYDYATDGGKIVIDRSLYQHWWNDDGVTVFPVYIDPGVDLEQARAALLEALARGLPRESVADGVEQRRIAPGDPSNFRPDLHVDLCAGGHRDHYRHAGDHQHVGDVGGRAAPGVGHVAGAGQQPGTDYGSDSLGSRLSGPVWERRWDSLGGSRWPGS
jgi:hypothetical protein